MKSLSSDPRLSQTAAVVVAAVVVLVVGSQFVASVVVLLVPRLGHHFPSKPRLPLAQVALVTEC